MDIETSTSRFDMIYGRGNLYVDKTSFLKQWWEKGKTVTVMTRPRRFGKSLLLSTIERFFEPNYRNQVKKTDGTPLFEGLDVWKDDRMQALHGTVPVISMTLSGAKDGTSKGLIEQLKAQVSEQYFSHRYVLDSPKLRGPEKRRFRKYIETGCRKNPGVALSVLCQYLSAVCETEPILLLDEYDTPLTEALARRSFDEIADTMGSFFSSAYGNNPYYSKCLMTGITGIAQQSLFEDCNWPGMDTVQDSCYPDALGYTGDEVEELLKMAEMEDKSDLVKRMYDGYRIGSQDGIYNPFSINQFLQHGDLSSYWINSSRNTLARNLISGGGWEIQNKVRTLIEGKSILVDLSADLVCSEMVTHADAVFSLLFYTGFLKPIRSIQVSVPYVDSMSRTLYEVAVPNGEVMLFFRDVCANWSGANSGNEIAPVRRV